LRVVQRDPPDSRDLYYRPTLRALGLKHLCGRLLLPVKSSADTPGRLRIQVRHQDHEGSCTGQALAALIDLLRDDVQPEQVVDRENMASARMLFEMAKLHEPASRGDEIYSLRAVLKGFYHNGVCSDRLWPYEASRRHGVLTVERAEEAKLLSLGAYYRLRPLLNDYHAALHEVGVVLAAAQIHGGWEPVAIQSERKRQIIRPTLSARAELANSGHAFLLVGYDQRGFLVLNSWGEDWGGYEEMPGISHWSYDDWSRSIMDAWVVRLAVPTPGSFAVTIGAQGLSSIVTPLDSDDAARGWAAGGATAPARLQPTIPRAIVLGRYAHFEDGKHLRRGSYPSDKGCVEASLDKLSQDPSGTRSYDHVLLWIEGGSEPTRELMAEIAEKKDEWKANRVYAYHVVWCADFVEECQKTLATLFAEASALTGVDGPYLDRQIEETVHGIGRAFWRDIAHAAETATASSQADGSHLLIGFARVAAARGMQLHLVAEGAGAILLAKFLRLTRPDPKAWNNFVSPISTLSLVYPATRLRECREDFGPLADCLGDRARLYIPSAELEKSMRVGSYGQSLLHLVSNAFEDRIEPPREEAEATEAARKVGLFGPPMLGMAKDTSYPKGGVPERGYAGLTVEDITTRDAPSPGKVLETLHGNRKVLEKIAFQVLSART
jgi:hypothetical protein